MSEANLPSSDPSQNQTPSDSNWDSSANADQAHTADGIAETQSEDWQDWQTVDFPNALSADAIERQSFHSSEDGPLLDWLAQATPNPSAAHLWSTGASNSAELPEIADLIALIQELNQCNDVLLDRVSQLEESLERSQKTQISQASASSHATNANQTVSSQLSQELSTAQAEITQLSQDLEFAQQTNQRQQILIETLTGQLEGSQERVAQLERECALTQQRYSEQSHQLTQSESVCRDLHTRLQRQQRHTLQFKAALEKCLEVPPPSYEAKQEVEAIADSQDKDVFTSQSFLPRAKRIQPWSAQPQFLSDLSDLNSDLNVDDLKPLDETQLTPQAQAETKDQKNHQFRPLAAASLDLPTVLASIIQSDQSALDEPAIELPSEQPPMPNDVAVPANPQPLSYDLKKSSGWWNEAALQPQSANSAPKSQAAQTNSEAQPLNSPSAPSEAPISVEVSENNRAAKPISSEESVQPQSSDAEDALWQDLARLIDVSTDDVVKASASDDFDSFETIAPSTSEPQPTSPSGSLSASTPSKQAQSQSSNVEQQIAQGISIANLLLSSSQASAAEQITPAPDTSDSKTSESEQKVPAAFTTHPNWPSPVVYPLRTSKKIESLAAVKLPTFPR